MLKPLERARIDWLDALSAEAMSKKRKDRKILVIMTYCEKRELPLSNHPREGLVVLVEVPL